MANPFSDIVIHAKVWRFLGFGSSIVGFTCYAFSPSFHDLFGHWNLLKILFYSILSIIFSVLMLFVNKCLQFSRGFLLKTHLGFLVLMLTSLYSFYEDRSKQGKEEKGYKTILSLVSFGAFALMSVSLSRQVQPEFDAGVSNFFLGCLIVAVMKMNIKIGLGAAVLFHVLIIIRSYWDSQTELPNVGDTERAIIEIDSQLHEMQSLANNGHEEAEAMIVSQSHIDMQSLANDGHEGLDTIEEIDKATDGNNIDELDMWLRAYEGTANFSCPF